MENEEESISERFYCTSFGYIFQDDFVYGNPLGSHTSSTKLGAVYSMIACLPRNLASKLNYILLTILYISEERKKYSTYEKLFGTLVAELNILRNKGISITVDNKIHTIYFQLVLILGDNLGLNSILSSIECFRGTTACRVCSAPAEEIKVLIREKLELIRRKESYFLDYMRNNASISSVKDNSIFNKVDIVYVKILQWM